MVSHAGRGSGRHWERGTPGPLFFSEIRELLHDGPRAGIFCFFYNLKNGRASLDGLVVGLKWPDLVNFFHHFFQGTVPKIEFGQKNAPGGLGGGGEAGVSAAASQKWTRASWGAPPCSHENSGGPKRAQKRPMGARGRPLGLGPYVGPLWAHTHTHASKIAMRRCRRTTALH